MVFFVDTLALSSQILFLTYLIIAGAIACVDRGHSICDTFPAILLDGILPAGFVNPYLKSLNI